MKKLLALPLLLVFLSGCVIVPGGGGNGFVGGDEVVKITSMYNGAKIKAPGPYNFWAYAKNLETNLGASPVVTKVLLSNPSCEASVSIADCVGTSFGSDETTGWGCEMPLHPQVSEKISWTINFKQAVSNIIRQCNFDLITEYEWKTGSSTNILFKDNPIQQEIKEPSKTTGPVKVYFKVHDPQPIQTGQDDFAIYLHIDKASVSDKEKVLGEIEITEIDNKKLPSLRCYKKGELIEIKKGTKLDATTGEYLCTAKRQESGGSFDISIEAKYTYEIVQKTPEVEVEYK